jgi:iron-regulated transporter 1
VTYPSMRRCLGLPWTGMLALALQSATLSMCVVSVWLPGSPFDMDHPDGDGVVCEANTTRTQANTTELTDLMAREIASKDGPTYTSIAVLMAGIIGARFGLWIADLAIAQMFMEVVAESERGVVNGVQQSLNQLMDVVKNVLVIILPKATQFGLLVLLSFAFVLSGLIMYIVFLVKVPRQLFQVKSSLGV